jgi:hypothetical protein
MVWHLCDVDAYRGMMSLTPTDLYFLLLPLRWPALQQQLEARKRRRGAEVKFQSAGQQLPPAGPGAASAAAAAAAMSSQPGAAAAGGAPKLVNIDARAAAAQALASTLVAGAKKSKWDK